LQIGDAKIKFVTVISRGVHEEKLNEREEGGDATCGGAHGDGDGRK